MYRLASKIQRHVAGLMRSRTASKLFHDNPGVLCHAVRHSWATKMHPSIVVPRTALCAPATLTPCRRAQSWSPLTAQQRFLLVTATRPIHMLTQTVPTRPIHMLTQLPLQPVETARSARSIVGCVCAWIIMAPILTSFFMLCFYSALVGLLLAIHFMIVLFMVIVACVSAFVASVRMQCRAMLSKGDPK